MGEREEQLFVCGEKEKRLCVGRKKEENGLMGKIGIFGVCGKK